MKVYGILFIVLFCSQIYSGHCITCYMCFYNATTYDLLPCPESSTINTFSQMNCIDKTHCTTISRTVKKVTETYRFCSNATFSDGINFIGIVEVNFDTIVKKANFSTNFNVSNCNQDLCNSYPVTPVIVKTGLYQGNIANIAKPICLFYIVFISLFYLSFV